MRATEFVSEGVDAKQVLQYVKRAHAPEQFGIDSAITDHPRWQLKNIPVSQLKLDPDGEAQDPYGRVNWVDYDKVRDMTPGIGAILKRMPIVVDPQGWIIDGNHRAAAAADAGMTAVPAYVPAEVAENLNESISPVVYHFTTIGPALKILQSGEFELSSVLGSVEQQYAPRGYPYFLSTTRTRRGGYHRTVGSTGVLFVLDGTWFNQRYPGGSIDYWLNRNPQQLHHREHEAEDRVFSRDPTVPITGVTGLHVYITPDAYPDQLAQARQLMIAAKRRGIATQLYRDETAWRNFDTRNTADVGQLRGQERTGGRISTHPGYLLPWIQLLTAREKSQLNKDADKIRYSLAYDYDRDQMAQRLNTDLSNARKPNSGTDREHAVKIIQFMRKNNLHTVKELTAALAQKWRPEDKKVSENFADGKKPGRKGLAKRMGVPTRASVSRLRQIAKSSSGEKARMAHWMANMKSGRQK